MMRCKECEVDFEEVSIAEDHIREAHTALCDNKLQEYVNDSVRDAYEELIEDV